MQRKFKHISIFAVLSVVSAFLILPTSAGAFVSGDGSEGSPYRIATCEQLQSINDDLDAYYELEGPIDCSDTENWTGEGGYNGFAPIGRTDENGFVGSFNGRGFTISDVWIEGSSDYNGLFGLTGASADITNVTVDNIYIEAPSYNGGLVGLARNTLIENVRVTGRAGGQYTYYCGGIVGYLDNSSIYNSSADVTIAAEYERCGGLVGYMENSEIEDVYAEGDVSGGTDYGYGGLVGYTVGSVMRDCAAFGDVTAPSRNFVGGLVGELDMSSIVECYATGNVIGGENVGGLVGDADNADGESEIVDTYARGSVTSQGDSGDPDTGGLIGDLDASLVNSYSTGAVLPAEREYVGGLIGYRGGSGVVDASFWDVETSGQEGSDGGQGLTTGQLTSSTFEGNGGSEWDFEYVWAYVDGVNDGYPCLLNAPFGCEPADSGEPEGPNGGDGNNDGTPDSEQPHVESTTLVSGKYVTLEVNEQCEIVALSVKVAADFLNPDTFFEYPIGFIDFELQCGDPGFETQVKKYYHDQTNQGFVLRKHNPSTGAYFTIDGAQIGSENFGGLDVLTASYTIVDGGTLDIDGEVNGFILDPAGLGIASVGAPRTGAGGTAK